MNRWMRVVMLLCGMMISVSVAHAVQQSDGKAMLERLAAKTKAEVSRLEQAEKKNASKTRAAVEQLAGRNIRPTRVAALGMGRMTGNAESCSKAMRAAGQDTGRIEKIRQELRQKKLLLRKTEAKLARLNQSAEQRFGQRVPSSQMVAAAEGETGSISGKVTDVDGTPVAGMYVYAYTSTNKYNYAGYGYTDADGSYTVSGLPSGSYKVRFDASGAAGSYISEWHSDKSSFETADLVQVTVPNAVTGINASLAPAGSISGKVTAVGNPVADVIVYVYTSTNEYNYAGYSYTGADGSYTVNGLPSGSYKVEFDASYADGNYISEWHSDKSSFETADLVQVTAPNAVTGINASLAPAGSISGKVTDAVGSPVVDVYVSVRTSTNEYYGYGYTDVDGSYTVSGLASGSYKVKFDTSYADGNYISEWHSDKDSFETADLVQVTAPNAVTGINASLASAGSISGKVTDVDGTPVAGVYVRVYTEYSVGCDHYNSAGYDYTAADGSYTVSGLASGSYKVQFDASEAAGSYISEWNSDKDSFETADSVQVVAPNAVTVNASLAAGGAISGKVTDAAGSPVADVAVRVYTSTYNSAGYGNTGADGSYTVSGLPSGSYKVEFDASYADGNYISEWHSDKSSFDAADLVQVTAPNAVTGINASLASAGSISGKVTDVDGTPVAGVSVYVHTSTNHYSFEYAGSDYTGADGSYTVSGLPSGSYKVEFDASEAEGNYASEWHSDKSSFDAADLVQVTAPNAVTVNADLAAGSSISGKVTDEAGKAIGSCWSYPWVTVQNSSTGDTIAETMVSSDGTYVIKGLPAGSYKVLFSALWLGYIPQWYNGKADFDSADAVNMASNSVVDNINAVMKIGGSISGKVMDADGKPVAYIWVSSSDSSVFGTKALARTDANGNYTLKGLPTGSYKVHFEADRTVYADEWYNNKRSFAAADSVSVTASNATADIDAALDPASPASPAVKAIIKTLLLRRK